MKKSAFTVLWILGFLLAGLGISAGFDLYIRSHPFDDHAWLQPLAGMIVFGLGPIGLPFLALALCKTGKLPGTQDRKDQV